MNKIIFWGAAVQAIVLEEFLDSLDYELVALFDNNEKVISPFSLVPLYYKEAGFPEWLKNNSVKDTSYSIAIGGTSGKDRVELHNMLSTKGLRPISLVHPRAFVANNAKLSEGCQVLANAAVCARTILGVATIVNTSANIGYGCVLGNGVHIAPGVSMAGCVEIGDFSFVGCGAVVLPRVKIGCGSIVGAGAVVTKDLPDGIVARGVPARIVRENKL
jgi:sugar O-acyltransferase (sialic acid O-acetyltransferase NeuD family)